MKVPFVSQTPSNAWLIFAWVVSIGAAGHAQPQPQDAALPGSLTVDEGYRHAVTPAPEEESVGDTVNRFARQADEGLREGERSSEPSARGPCGWECDFCWTGTPWEDNCDWAWEGDGQCDCGCQFEDTADCVSPALPDLVVEESFVDAETEVLPGAPVVLSDTVNNVGVGPADIPFRMMWFISEDDVVTTADLAWGFRVVRCCLVPFTTSSAWGFLSWPDFAPYNTPGQTYYVALVADDSDGIVESDEENNWGAVWSVTVTCGAELSTTAPNHNESLWRSANNIVRLAFDEDITTPAEGDVQVRALLDSGLFGPDLSASFDFAVEEDDQQGPRTLRIQERGDVLTHRNWYGISSIGWSGVCGFEVHYVLQVGDASNDGRVLAFEVSLINMGIPEFAAADDDRRDIDGDGQILNFDVSIANGSIPSFQVLKPTGH